MKKWLTNKPFAHRGLHGPHNGFIENSPSAFRAAAQEGYGIELDVLLSEDEKAVVIHDTSLERLTGLPEVVGNLKAREIEKRTLKGSKDNIPLLKSVLDHLPENTPVLVEIKGDQNRYNELSKAVWQDIKNHKGKIAIMSFYPGIVRYFKERHPDVTRGLVATSIDDGDLPPDYFDVCFQIGTIKALKVDFIAYDISALPNDATLFCRENKIPVLTWTVRTEAQRKHARLNTDNIIFEL